MGLMRVTWNDGSPGCYEILAGSDCIKSLAKEDMQRLRRVLDHVLEEGAASTNDSGEH